MPRKNASAAARAPAKKPMSFKRPWRDVARRKRRQIMVGVVAVCGDVPFTAQTMTGPMGRRCVGFPILHRAAQIFRQKVLRVPI